MSWKTQKLGDICEILSGGTPSTIKKEYWGDKYLWLTPKDMGKIKTKFADGTTKKISALGLKKSSTKLLPKQSIILSSRAPIGHVAINTKPMAFNQGCRGLIPSKHILVDYLYYFLISSKKQLNDLGRGTTFKELSHKKLTNVELQLPPIDEQRAIVGKIDAVFENIDKALALTKEKAKEVKSLKASLLNNLLQQANSDCAKNWQSVKIGDVCEIKIGKTPTRNQKKYWDEDKKGKNIWLSIADLAKTSNKLVYDSKEYVSDEGASLFNAVEAGTLLMSYKLTIGRLAFAATRLRTNEAIAALYINDENNVDKYYLYYFLHHYNWIKETECDKKLKGRTLNKKKLSKINVTIPPLDEQRAIVGKLDAMFAQTEKLENILKEKEKNYSALKNALLKQMLAENSKAAA